MTIQEHLNYCKAYMLRPEKLTEILCREQNKLSALETQEKLSAFANAYQKYAKTIKNCLTSSKSFRIL